MKCPFGQPLLLRTVRDRGVPQRTVALWNFRTWSHVLSTPVCAEEKPRPLSLPFHGVWEGDFFFFTGIIQKLLREKQNKVEKQYKNNATQTKGLVGLFVFVYSFAVSFPLQPFFYSIPSLECCLYREFHKMFRIFPLP